MPEAGFEPYRWGGQRGDKSGRKEAYFRPNRLREPEFEEWERTEEGGSSGQKKPTSRQKKCDLCVTCERMPEDLRRVMKASGRLSPEDRRTISEVVKSSCANIRPAFVCGVRSRICLAIQNRVPDRRLSPPEREVQAPDP